MKNFRKTRVGNTTQILHFEILYTKPPLWFHGRVGAGAPTWPQAIPFCMQKSRRQGKQIL